MKRHWNPREEIPKWKTERVDGGLLKLCPVIGEVYPLKITKVEHTGCITDISPFMYPEHHFEGVYAGIRGYYIFYAFNKTEGKPKMYYTNRLIFGKDHPTEIRFEVDEWDLPLVDEEKEKAIQMLRLSEITDVLPFEERRRLERQDIARVLQRAIESGGKK